MENDIKITGNVVIKNTDTGEILAENHNLVVTGGKTFLAKMLAKTETTGITYIALGTGQTAVQSTDYQLVNEIKRAQVAQTEQSGNKVTFSTFFSGTEVAVQTIIYECGLFGGSTATASANSGTMVARTLNTFDNTNANNITCIWTLTLNA